MLQTSYFEWNIYLLENVLGFDRERLQIIFRKVKTGASPLPNTYSPELAKERFSWALFYHRSDLPKPGQGAAWETEIEADPHCTTPLTSKKQQCIKQEYKSVFIDIKDTLKENTTYSINFNESIADITENNKLKNFKYV